MTEDATPSRKERQTDDDPDAGTEDVHEATVSSTIDLTAAVGQTSFVEAARAAREGHGGLPDKLALACALADAVGAEARAKRLAAETHGFQDSGLPVPEIRKVMGFASPFPVRALDQGMLLPEEIFLANREKFSQVTLTIGQPIAELQSALSQIQQGGVLALRVPAAEITGASADTEDDTEVYIYILPREIQKIVDAAQAEALDVLCACLIESALGPETSSDESTIPPSEIALSASDSANDSDDSDADAGADAE
ncbi:MAG: hypothetical protein AAFV29_12690 [Myxococcota bacterium]